MKTTQKFLLLVLIITLSYIELALFNGSLQKVIHFGGLLNEIGTMVLVFLSLIISSYYIVTE